MGDDAWIDNMFSEMRSARKNTKDHSIYEEKRQAAIDAVVQKYFRPGMPKEEAFVMLRQLQAEGFWVTEYRHEGVRGWPDGELQPYREDRKRNMQNQNPEGVSKFIARREQPTLPVIFAEHIVVSFTVSDRDGTLTESGGSIGGTGL